MGLFSDLFNAQATVYKTQKDFELAQWQNEQNIQQWNRENAYNDPAAVMARLRRAGLNPALMYEGGAGQLQSAPSPEMVGSRASVPTFTGDPLSELSNARLLSAQAGLAEAQEDSIRSKLPDEINNLREQNNKLKAEIDNLNQQNKESFARINAMTVENQLRLAQKLRIEFQSKLDQNRYSLDVERLKNDMEDSAQSRAESRSRVRYTNRRIWEDIQTWQYRLLGFDLENNRIRQATNLTIEQVENAKKDGQLLGFQINSGRIEDYLNQRDWKNYNSDRIYQLYPQRYMSNALHYVGRVLSPIGSALSPIIRSFK